MGMAQTATAADVAMVYDIGLRAFLAPIATLLDDASISEIIIIGPDRIYLERGGQLVLSDCRFASRHALAAAVNTIAQFCGKTITDEKPIIDGRLNDGSRICIVMPPVSGEEISVNIRRFSRAVASPDFLLEKKAVTPVALEFLELSVKCKQNIIVSGGTGSGKTTTLNILSRWFDPTHRILVIEDTRELQIQQEHVVSMEARAADVFGKGAVTIRDMFIASLRMRPDRIIVGECRGSEAFDMLQAMNSGHGGTMTTVHADSPLQACGRLEAMSLMANVGLPAEALRRQLALAVNLIVQASRLHDGRRAITHISEVYFDAEKNSYATDDIFVLRPNETGFLELTWTGRTPLLKNVLPLYGLDAAPNLTKELFAAKTPNKNKSK
ncbi:MAG: Flp pilus assembly complex ATPase component TadA [Planctomycetota bacterium]|jgi:pilus assembly protein CpaF|nr:Flp pilus assembly complex ATPase component TadA [Planctomycetota bacterium]